MATQLEAAVLAAYKGLQAVHGVNVTYSRPSTGQSVPLTRVVPGKSTHDVTSDGVIIEQVKSRDYLIQASLLKLEGVAVLPQRGDRIQEGSKTYAILATGMEAQWKWTDQTQQILRIHTKEIHS